MTAFLKVPATRIVKSILYIVDEKKKVLVLIRADKEINEVKLTHLWTATASASLKMLNWLS